MDVAKTARALGVATPAMKTLVKRLQIEQKNIAENNQKA
jgi:hypothetical protein